MMVGIEVSGQSGSRPQSKGCAQNLEAGKDKEMNNTFEPLEGTQSCQHWFEFIISYLELLTSKIIRK